MRWKALFVVLSICPLAAVAKTPKLFGVPVQYTSDSGYVFGVAGVLQYDHDGYSNGGYDPSTGMPLFKSTDGWNRSELDPYFKTPNGLEVQLGYDWNRSWTTDYIQYSTNTIGDFRLGQFLTPVGWEQLEGAPSWTFLTPSLPDLAISETFRIGARWSYGKIPHWFFQVAYFSGGDLSGKFPGHTYAGRVVFNPVSTKKQVIHIGLSASREYPSDHTAKFFAPPEASLTKTYLVTTKSLPLTHSIDRAGLELGFLHGPLFAQGEYLELAAHRDDGLPEFRGHGYYLLASWMLTGETARTYKFGKFQLPKPEHKFGAFEIAARYSELNLEDGIVQGGREDNWTVGVNWYVNTNLELQANYVWAHANHSPANLYVAPIDPRIFEVRAQVSFGP